MNFQHLSSFFNPDPLAGIMLSLIGFIGIAIYSFSNRYLKGDTHHSRFNVNLAFLIASLSIMVMADHLAVMLAGWIAANFLLVRMMVHKAGWKQAKASGMLAARNFGAGAISIGAAFALLYSETGLTSIRAITQQALTPNTTIALSILVVGAMTQSAIRPFHGWLISSLNSPTPVSALMHAGLVNGGGFLLVRFAPLYAQAPSLLTVIFLIGIVTALTGTLWKLMQTDIKRMLACSTMGQMGFMIAQIGLGMFPAAVAHLCWHGLFKAYLFLSSGSAAQEKRLDLGYPPSLPAFILSLVCGLAGAAAFGMVTGLGGPQFDSTLVLLVLAFMAASQLALPVLNPKPVARLPLALALAAAGGTIYGGSVRLIEWILEPMGLMHPQPLSFFHLAGMAILAASWIAVLFGRNAARKGSFPKPMLEAYVSVLNASQPNPKTVTANRMDYQF